MRPRNPIRITVFVATLIALTLPAFAQSASAPPAPDPPPASASAPVPVSARDHARPSSSPPQPRLDAPDPADATADSKPDAATEGTKHPINFGLNAGLGRAPPTVHRDTPRATVQGFLEATQREDYLEAAHYIHLWGLAPHKQKDQGPILAKQLADILERAVWIDLEQIPDNPSGTEKDGGVARDDVRIATVDLDRGTHAIRLARVRDPFTTQLVWVFSASTIQSMEALDKEYGLPGYVQELPPWTYEHKVLGLAAFQWGGLVVLGLFAWLVGLMLELPLLWLVRRLVRKLDGQRQEFATRLTRGLVHWFVALLLFLALLPLLRLSATAAVQLERLVITGVIFIVMVAGLRFTRIAVEAVRVRHEDDTEDPTRLRSLMTRLDAVRRIGQVLIVVVAVALALMQFPTARTVGLSLLGSAGIAGAILGFAAQKTFANLFSGILISFTQPMRIGDTVIVEKEWGVIEAIGATHVVVKIWDSRRLVLPVTYFLDKPFENWTKVSPELWGTIILHADYRVDVDAFRAELDRVLENEPLWNQQAKSVIVYDVTEHTAVLRITVSADDATKLWDLRCLIREKMLAYLQREPWRLPRHRIDGAQRDPDS